MWRDAIVRSCAVGALVVASAAANAQWSSDPMNNLVVAGGGGDQGVPVVRASTDGGAWFFFFDNGVGGAGYKPVAQRVSADGYTQIAGHGMVMANRTNTATYVSDMRVDRDNNCIAAFDDNSSGASLIAVQKVGPYGSSPWGPTPLAMPGSTGALGPRVCVCPDGSYVAIWALSNVLNFQRISSAGTLGASWTYSDTGHYLAISDVVPGRKGGEFITLWVRGSNTNAQTSSKGLQVQKWGSSNTPAWNGGTPVDVMTYSTSAGNTRSIQNGYWPSLVSDGDGGAVCAWYDIGTNRQARLQHVDFDGVPLFAPDGLWLTTTPVANELRLSASVAYDVGNQEYSVAYERSNPNQSQFGMAAQRVDSAGTLLWGGAGLEIVPYSGNHVSNINAVWGGDAAVFLWIQYLGGNGPMLIHATKVSSEGTFLWTPSTIGVGSNPSNKDKLRATLCDGSDMIIAGWADGAAGAADVLGQNINPDGTLGNACPADFNRSGGVPDDADIAAFFAAWNNGEPSADLNRSGGTPDDADVAYFFVRWNAGC